eukprot:gene2660-3076_t
MAVKDAIQKGEIDPKNKEALKQFRKDVPIAETALEDIESPPDSDDEEGLLLAKTKQLNALQEGKTRDVPVIDWLQKPHYVVYLWDTMPSFTSEQINKSLQRSHVYLGACSGDDLKQLLLGNKLKSKKEYAETLLPLSLVEIKMRRGLLVFSEDLRKHVQNQVKLSEYYCHKYIVIPVLKTQPESMAQGTYWTISIAVIQENKKLIVFLDPLGQPSDVDVDKMCFYLDEITEVCGMWTKYTNDQYEESCQTHIPITDKIEDCGVFSFLYAVEAIGKTKLPKTIDDIEDIRLWMLEKIVKGHGTEEENSFIDDDDTQFDHLE